MKKGASKYTQPDFQFIRFSLAGREFGIHIGEVKEIIRPRVPDRDANAPDFIEGFIRLRSMSLPVVDLRKRFSLPAAVSETSRIIIVSIGSIIVGLMVDEVSDIAQGANEVTLRPEGAGDAWDGCIEASVETEAGRVLIIVASSLLTGPEIKALGNPAPVAGRQEEQD